MDAILVRLVIEPDGRLYASDRDRGLINMEDSTLFHQILGTPTPRAISFDQDGNLHFGKWTLSVIQVFTRSGVLLRCYTLPSSTHSDGRQGR